MALQCSSRLQKLVSTCDLPNTAWFWNNTTAPKNLNKKLVSKHTEQLVYISTTYLRNLDLSLVPAKKYVYLCKSRKTYLLRLVRRFFPSECCYIFECPGKDEQLLNWKNVSFIKQDQTWKKTIKKATIQIRKKPTTTITSSSATTTTTPMKPLQQPVRHYCFHVVVTLTTVTTATTATPATIL